MANFNITAPDGTKYQITAPDNATQDQVLAYAQSQHVMGKQPGYIATDTKQFTPIENAGKPAAAPTGNAALGALQGLSNSILGAGNAISAGAYATLKPHAGIAEASQNFDKANQFLQGNQIGPSQDVNTEAGRQAVQGAFSKLSGAPQAFYDAGVNKLTGLANKLPWAPAVNNFINQHHNLVAFQNATQTGGDVAANTVLPAAVMGTAKLGAGAVTDAIIPKETPFQQANRLGFNIRPSDAVSKGGSAPIAKRVEGFVGGPQTAKEASLGNQPRTNELALEDVKNAAPGVNFSKDTQLTPDTFEAAYAPNEAVYQKVSNLGRITTDDTYAKAINGLSGTSDRSFQKAQGKGINADINELKDIYSEPDFDAADALEHIKDLRSNARSNYQAASNPQVKNGASLKKLADAQEQVSNALIDQIDRWAESRPEGFEQTGLGQQFKQARRNIAIIHTIEDSVKPGTTDASAGYFGKQLAKDKPISGNAKEIGEVYNNFDANMKDAGPLRNKSEFNRLEGTIGIGGAALAGVEKNPAIFMKTLGLLAAPPITRKLMLSTPFQNSMLPKPSLDPFLTRGLLSGLPVGINAQGNQK